jgi:hypothetical protein
MLFRTFALQSLIDEDFTLVYGRKEASAESKSLYKVMRSGGFFLYKWSHLVITEGSSTGEWFVTKAFT